MQALDLDPQNQKPKKTSFFYFCKTYSLCGPVLLEIDWIKTCRNHD